MRTIAAVALLVAAACVPCAASPTRTLMSSPAELQRADAEGVGVSARGRLFLAPRLTAGTSSELPGGPAYVWAVAVDTAGNTYLGTGPDGRVLKVTAAGAASVFFQADEPMITALAILPSGELLAGTAPDGKIYRIGRDGRGTLWADLDERYVWSLAVGPGGTVWAGTGDKGLIVAVDPDGRAKTVFDSDDAHIVALTPLRDGGWLAGGAGRGLLYRIAADGKTTVIHDDDLPEARAVARRDDGDILAVFVAPPESDRRPPAVRIQVAGAGGAGPGADAVGEMDDRRGTLLQGVIEGLGDGSDEGVKRTRGRVVRIAPDGAVDELWRSSSEAPFSLVLDGAGRAIFGTGEPARLYRVEADGDVGLLATMHEGQVTALVPGERGIVVGTSNPAALYRLDRAPADSGTFVARPIDAGGSADWGQIRWRVEGSPGRIELTTRSGHSAEPDGTWSEWSPPLTIASGSPAGSPRGRFFQWRARLFGSGGEGWMTGPTITVLTQNRPPALRDVRLDPPAASVSGRVPLRWVAQDPDGDPLAFEIQYRPEGSASWITGARLDPPAAKPGEAVAEPDTSWKDGKLVWDASAASEGSYEVRLVASDRASTPSGEGRDTSADLGVLVTVDRTPPVIEARRIAGGGLEVVVTDATSPIARLEVVAEGHALFSPRPSDSVCDAPRETFRLSPAEAGENPGRILRAMDAAGNAAETAVPSP